MKARTINEVNFERNIDPKEAMKTGAWEIYKPGIFIPLQEFKDKGGPWHSAPQNIRLIRTSEVYLNAAEAALMLGQTDKALTYINKVRERARNCGTTGAPAALTSVTMNDIMHERRVEFSSEGQRYGDIVRWGVAADLLNATPTADGFDREYVVGKHEFFPLPNREISLSNGKLEQYDGWK